MEAAPATTIGGGNHSGAAAANLDPASVFLSVIEDGSLLSFACYNEEKNTILLENCMMNAYESADQIERVLLAMRPTLLLLPSKIVSNHGLLQLLTKSVDADDGGEPSEVDGIVRPRCTPYQVIKSSSLDVRSCKALTMKLRVKSLLRHAARSYSEQMGHGARQFHEQPNQTFEVSAFHALATIIDFNSKVQVQAIGSLLNFLQNTIFQHEQGGLIQVDDVMHAHSSSFMKVPAETFSALHIFATDYHPLVAAKGTGNSKEGFSLFSLLDRTHTRAGRARLREWMRKPLLELHQIELRQDGVELFLLPDLKAATERLTESIASLGPVASILARTQKSSATPNDFVLLPKAISAAISVCEILEQDFLFHLQHSVRRETNAVHDLQQQSTSQNRYMGFVQSILSRCHPHVLRELLERIVMTVDDEATTESSCVVIRSGYSENLDYHKDRYAGLHDAVKQASEATFARLPHIRSVAKGVFFPQVGFLLSLRRHSCWAQVGDLTDDFAHVFTEGSVMYFKNAEMNALDADIGDPDAIIKDIELQIAGELEDEILDSDMDLRQTFDALADLDCVLAFASVATEYAFVRPTMLPAQENLILIRNGAHPLQELLMEHQFVRNDTLIDSERRVNVITGPNFSGKSCYARQVGILTYMAHIGMFLPCEDAQISMVDRILTQFSTVESCNVPQSSFQLDLTRMGAIMRSATPYSLVLVDEFGKGTSPSSGISLLTAALRKLSSIGCKVLCTTHFQEIFSMDLVRDNEDGFKAIQMAVQIPNNDQDLAVPLFKLTDGVAGSSAGLVCAQLSGVKQSVIDRAKEILLAMRQGRALQPLPEILSYQLNLSESSKETIAKFLFDNWSNASDEEVAHFYEAMSLEQKAT